MKKRILQKLKKGIMPIGLGVALLTSDTLIAQISINQNFEGGYAGWEISGLYSDLSTSGSCEGTSARLNVYSSLLTNHLTSPNFTGVSNGEDLTVSFDYKYGDYDTPHPHPEIVGTVSTEYTLDNGLTWNLIETITSDMHTPSPSCSTVTYTLPSGAIPSGSDFKLRVTVNYGGTGDYYLFLDNISANQLAVDPPNCNAVLTASTSIGLSGGISWSAATGSVEGYRLSAGTSSGGTDVMNNIDVGNVTAYTLGTLASGTTYYVTITPYNSFGNAVGCTEQTFTTIPPAPVNDDCSGAIAIPCGGSVSGSILTATQDDISVYTSCGELSLVNGTYFGMWYTVTPVYSGEVVISTCGSAGFDTYLRVYDGSCGTFTCVAYNDDGAGCADNTSSVVFVGEGGTTYYILLGKYSSTAPSDGSFTISATCPESCSVPSSISAGFISSTGANITWSDISGAHYIVEYGPSGYTSGVSDIPGTGGTLVSSTATSPTFISGLDPGTTYDVYLRRLCDEATYSTNVTTTFTTKLPPPVNDECTDAIILVCGAPPISGTTMDAVPEGASVPGFCASDLGVWYKYEGDGNVVTVSSTTSGWDHELVILSGECGSLTNVLCKDEEYGGTETATFLTVTGTNYYIYVAHYSTTSSVTGDFIISATCEPPAAMSYVSSTTTQSSTDVALTGSSNQQIVRVAVQVIGTTSPLSVTQLDFNTIGTAISGEISAARVYYTGVSSTFSATTQFGSEVLSPFGDFTVSGSQVLTGGLSNTTNYFWLVYDISSTAAAGNTVDAEVLNVTVGGTVYVPTVTNPSGTRTIQSPLVNDEASGAIELTVDGGCPSTFYTNVFGSRSSGEPVNSCYQSSSENYSSVWFKFIAPASGSVRISTDYATGTLSDTYLGLFEVGDVTDYSSFTIIACDDDNGTTSGGGNSKSILYATGLIGEQVYYVMVNGWNNTSGTFCVTVDELTSSMLATSGSCVSGQILYVLPTYVGQSALVDLEGNLRAIVEKNTAGVGASYITYTSHLTLNDDPSIREDMLGNAYLDRNFSINSVNTDVKVKLFFLDSELTALGTTLDQLEITKVSGASCSADVPEPGSPGDRELILQTGNGSYNGVSWVEFSTHSFSNFYLASAHAPLAIELGKIDAENRGSMNVVTWNTLREESGDILILERSKDGRIFSPVAEFKANGIPSYYQYIDEVPYNGVNLYRVRIHGKAVYSDVVNAYVLGSRSTAMNVFPNPTKGQFQIELSEMPENGKVYITDLAGRTVYSIENMNTRHMAIDATELPSGIYFVNYIDDRRSEVIKITKD